MFRPIFSFLKKFVAWKRRDVSAQDGSFLAKLDSIYVEDIMVERSKIVALDVRTMGEGLLEVLKGISHSRVPVFDGNLDKIVGFIHVKDVLNRMGAPFNIRSALRKIVCVPPSMKASGLLMEMKAARVHVAVVVDEFGATVGVVTMTDIVEQILGDIQDEHGVDAEPSFLRVGSDKFEVSTGIEMKEFLDKSGLELKAGHGSRTLGGYILSIAGKVPSVGDVVSSPEGVEFTILDADNKKIGVVLVDASRIEN
ncbi:transporter associated domain-containing protein [Neorickettsia sennetsu]|uniref:CBS/transporter associated domain protein n=1 Tax=Ehrlichia sennetsu (strain ATCC VR-367 / Miyayama) TaxID=222891 RepID=Q2GE80_EHRS3|nr:transporter associated domain-containing protein [Neorickettsia sennetsu]ABD46242.1 CBS/transporter associated domain protein [Neorickettsia sennetsu str. Miyayama]